MLKCGFWIAACLLSCETNRSDLFQAHTPYPCGDHYFGGLFTPYGPQTQALVSLH